MATILKQTSLIILAAGAFACAYYITFTFPVWMNGTAMIGALGCAVAGIVAILYCAVIGSEHYSR